MRGAEAGGRGTVPGGQPGHARQFADLRFAQARVHQRRLHLVLPRGILAGAVVAQVVGIYTVDDVGDAALAADFFQAREQFVLAVEAAVGVVLQVIGIFEFARLDIFVRDSELPHESLGIALVRLRDGGRIRGYGQSVGAERLVRSPRQIGGIRPSGIGHHYPVQPAQHGEQLVLLRIEQGGIGYVDQGGHSQIISTFGGAGVYACRGSPDPIFGEREPASGGAIADAVLLPSSMTLLAA